MIVLGVDPGTAITGYGLVSDSSDGSLHQIDYGVIRTKAKTPYPQRVKKIHEGINSLIDEYKPDVVAIEELFFNKNISTAMLVAQARGVVILTSAIAELELREYTPIQVKQAVTGYGRADKAQIQQMIKVLLGLSEIPKPDDAADALALAICHLSSYRMRNALGTDRKI
ncbi:crossover junction endodeoxyribonuclease RuvC [Candidatus Poribacteria bacterium]|nr:crossover junction endodeoxyribonuclease RuvC [Candidatus Poribacteria bacterium]